MSSLSRQNILDDVSAERERQEHLKAMGKFPHTPADPGALTAPESLAVLAEEFGEVAMLVADAVTGRPLDPGNLREELIQVAAVCVAWVEGLDAALEERPTPAVLMYSDLYSDEELADAELADAAVPSSRRDWQRDPEVGA